MVGISNLRLEWREGDSPANRKGERIVFQEEDTASTMASKWEAERGPE